MDWAEVFSGGLVGLLVGLTGVGGGSLMTPVLVLFFGVQPMSAVGTDLWFSALTKLAGAPIHQLKQAIDWPVARRLWLGSLPASLWALRWLDTAASAARHRRLVLIGIATSVLVASIAMWVRSYTDGPASGSGTSPQPISRRQGIVTIVLGALLGAVVTLTSVGAGAIGAVVLAYLYPARLYPSRLVATDLVHAIPLTLFAGFGHLILGDIQFTLLGTLLLGSIPAVLAGSLLAHRIPPRWLRRLLSLLLLAIGIRMWVGS